MSHATGGSGPDDALGGDGAVQRLMDENAVLSTELRDARAQLAARGAELGRAREEQAALRREAARLAQQCDAAEELRSDLAKLHVATRALHASLDPEQVLDALEEVVINLVGSECFGVFALEPATQSLQCLRAFGYDPDREGEPTLASGRIAHVVRTGQAHVRDEDGDDVLRVDAPVATVALRAGEETVGVLLVFRLLPQKPALTAFDADLFELVTVHAGTALHAARLHQASRGPREVAA